MLKNCRPQPVTLPLQFRIILPNIVLVLKSRSASATTIKDVLLVCMVLNGEGVNWLWSTWVTSCFR